jgi:CheY-like chemotaxis protein
LTSTLASDGQLAVQAITEAAPEDLPDLILMDLQMPVMDGYSATQHIRQWETVEQRKPLPIIALTADAFEENRQHCLAVGMNDFLTKPIAIDALKSALAKWLRGKAP